MGHRVSVDKWTLCVLLNILHFFYSRGVRRSHMDTIKVGNFIKELRKEKSLSQEKLAEVFMVSRRTVSRWETGSNMPDLDILIEMADYFDVDLREILDGERKIDKMDQELKDTVLKVVDYTNEDKKRLMRVTLVLFVVGIISIVFNQYLNNSELPSTNLLDFIRGLTTGLSIGSLIVGILYVSGALFNVRKIKMRMFKRIVNKGE